MPKKEMKKIKLSPDYKVWFEVDGDYIFGKGAFAILNAIHEEGTITKGANKLGMSYRYAWGVIKKIEKKLDCQLIETFRGGTTGGGGARVTEHGIRLIESYTRLDNSIKEILRHSDSIRL
ncbi:LysR family transcriptional regulator [Candidatus Thorarchaeota archaeon]|nr:MAG: LysR family transcriptional regulator [Candidatus Thorarchaeota archaeon]